MTTIVKAASAAQFLALVPRMLGYRPTRSLVLIPFAGSRSLGAMRIDLPADAESVDAAAATVLGMVCRLPEADAVARSPTPTSRSPTGCRTPRSPPRSRAGPTPAASV